MIKKLIFFILLISFIFFLIDFFYLNEEYIEFIISSLKSLFKGEERIKESTDYIDKIFKEDIENIVPTNIVSDNIIKLINKEREKLNIHPLQKSSSLTDAARERSKDMLEGEYLGHITPEGEIGFKIVLNKMGIKYKDANENIEAIPAFVGTAENIVQGWMDSKGHRENMLNRKWSKVGIGVVDKDFLRVTTAIFTD